MAHRTFTLMNLFREFFSLKKTLESPIANRIGIQVLRKVAFKCAYNYISNRASRRDSTIKRFKKDGYFVMHNFLSKDDFDTVKREYYKSLDNLQPGSKNPDLYGCYQIFQVLKDHNINVLHDI